MSIDLSQFHEVYFDESFEGTEVMEKGLLALEPGSNDLDSINEIFRAAHSIKGGAGTFGFDDIIEFTHMLETLLDQMRSGTRIVTAEGIQLLLTATDCLTEMLHRLQDGESADPGNASDIINDFKTMLADGASSEDKDDAEEEVQEGSSDLANWKVSFKPEHHLLRTGNEPLRMFRELGQLGELNVIGHTDDLPAFDTIVPEECYLFWDMEISPEGDKVVEEHSINEIFEWVIDECKLEIEEEKLATEEVVVKADDSNKEEAKAEEKPAAEKTNKPPVKKAERKTTEAASIRVAIDKIDGLINMVGELVITQSMLGQLSKNFKEESIPDVLSGLAQLEHNTRELQESVMRIRMLPISFAFARFPRMVRDLSLKLDKQIELKLLGETTELDKTVMEKIGDPLVHLVRNSLDHGIEPKDIRAESGKPEVGTITLNAYHQGGNIVIEVCDDGGGLKKEKILEKAVKNGLVRADETVSDDRIYDLIFSAGFSTADAVSDVSGRGVGMDVVRRNIESLNGNVEVDSRDGIGTTFTIRLPLTLAILDGQMIRVGGQVYILPLVSIVESIQIDIDLVTSMVGQGDIFRLRQENVPIVHLSELFGIVRAKGNLEKSLMVVVEHNNTKIGVIVDELLDQQQVVIKSLESNYERVDGISGATILGDGTVALIIDINGLIKLAGTEFKESINRICSQNEKVIAA